MIIHLNTYVDLVESSLGTNDQVMILIFFLLVPHSANVIWEPTTCQEVF